MTLGFRQGTDPQLAQVNVRNRVAQAEPLLPEAVRRGGVYVDQASSSAFMYVSLVSDSGQLDETALGDFAAGSVLPLLRRLPGIGKAEPYGAEYALRIWFDPDKLHAFNLTTADVEAAIRARNGNVTPGQLGAAPAVPGQPFQAIVRPPAPMSDAQAFGRIVVRAATDGSAVLLRDVARVELAASDYRYGSTLNTRNAASIGLKLADGANVLQASRTVRAALDEASRGFPGDVRYEISYDGATFVQASISRVLLTLAEATVLVFLILYLFLGNLRATLMPGIVVPVSLLGTVACLYALGLSLNVITLFAVVLAIGILVDDAIVVVENAERIMRTDGVGAMQAAARSMREVSGALVAVTLVLCAVFVPWAFFGSAVGVIYRHFAVTLAVSIAFSLFFALTLAPAMCASLLRHSAAPARGPLAWFDARFAAFTARYAGWVQALQRKRLRWLAVYLALTLACGYALWKMPSGLLPEEDTGEIVVDVELPAGGTQADTRRLVAELEQWLQQERYPVRSSFAVLGWSSGGSGELRASLFIGLTDWKTRGRKDNAQAVLARLSAGLETWPGRGAALCLQQFGAARAGQHRRPRHAPGGAPAGGTRGALCRARQADRACETGSGAGRGARHHRPAGTGAGPEDRLPQGRDFRRRCRDHPPHAVGHAGLALYRRGRARRPRAARHPSGRRTVFRMHPDQLARVHVRNAQGAMVSLAAFASLEWGRGEVTLERFDGFSSVRINAEVAPGHTTGAAMQRLTELVRGLGPEYDMRWTGRAFEQQQTGTQAPWLFALSLLFIFLCLVALYESWTLPLAVIVIVPTGLMGAAAAIFLRGMPNDVYFKVGVVVIMGLAAKNAILIVEYAE